MRAGRPRSQAMPSRAVRWGVWRATSQKADVHPFGKLPFGEPAPALPGGLFEEKQPIVNEDEPPMDTNKHE